MEKLENVVELTHPLLQHKITMLRDKNTGTAEFRALVEEIAMLEAFEALNDLQTVDIECETPIEKCMAPVIAGRKMAIVPILRAGLGMVNGIQRLVPTAKIGHIGMYRDEETHEPHEYYCKLPSPIEERLIVVTDPMLATGGSAIDAIDLIKQHGGKRRLRSPQEISDAELHRRPEGSSFRPSRRASAMLSILISYRRRRTLSQVWYSGM